MEDKEFHFEYIKFEMYTEQMREVKEATELMGQNLGKRSLLSY